MQNMLSVAQKRAQLQKRILISIYLSSVDYTVETFFAQTKAQSLDNKKILLSPFTRNTEAY